MPPPRLRLLLVDNYDSFTFNLAQLFAAAGAPPLVVRADEVDAGAVDRDPPDALVLSPGPGRPVHAGRSLELVRLLAGRRPILGVCLGHQALVEAHGGRVERARAPLHGAATPIHHDRRGLFRGLPSPLAAARYHSLIAKMDDLPSNFTVSAVSEGGEVMAVSDERRGLYGVQFHPESFMTSFGKEMVINFLSECAFRRDG